MNENKGPKPAGPRDQRGLNALLPAEGKNAGCTVFPCDLDARDAPLVFSCRKGAGVTLSAFPCRQKSCRNKRRFAAV